MVWGGKLGWAPTRPVPRSIANALRSENSCVVQYALKSVAVCLVNAASPCCRRVVAGFREWRRSGVVFAVVTRSAWLDTRSQIRLVHGASSIGKFDLSNLRGRKDTSSHPRPPSENVGRASRCCGTRFGIGSGRLPASRCAKVWDGSGVPMERGIPGSTGGSRKQRSKWEWRSQGPRETRHGPNEHAVLIPVTSEWGGDELDVEDEPGSIGGCSNSCVLRTRPAPFVFADKQ